MHPMARAAYREGLASSDRTTRLFALRGFRRIERPEPADYAAVKRALEDKNETVRHAAGIVIMSPAWQRAYHEWKGR